MIYWTFKSIFGQPLSILISALGIAVALILGLFLDAVFRGEASQILTFIERSPGQVWVLEGGVENLHMARSVVGTSSIEKIGNVDGVNSLISMMYRDSFVGEKGKESLTYVAGIPSDPYSRNIWEQATGWNAPEAGGIIIPEAMAAAQNLQIGDEISLASTSYTISGFSDGTSSMANTLMFIDQEDALIQFNQSEGVNIVLVDPISGVSAEQLAERINAQVEGVNAITREQLMKNDFNLALDMGGALIAMMSMIGTIVAGLIVVFTAYTFVSVRISELALVKALGAPGSQLMICAMLQTGIVALIGVVLAIGAIWPIQAMLDAWVPGVAVDFSFEAAFRLGIATLIIAELAAIVPAIYLRKVDPALVFNG